MTQEQEKDKFSKKIVDKIRISEEEDVDWMRKESNKAKFTNNLCLLLCQYLPKNKRENLIEGILR